MLRPRPLLWRLVFTATIAGLVVSGPGAEVPLAAAQGRCSSLFRSSGANRTGAAPESVSVGDFDRDGRLDLVVANTDSTTVSVFLGNGDGTLQPVRNIPVGAGPHRTAVDDFDGDGR